MIEVCKFGVSTKQMKGATGYAGRPSRTVTQKSNARKLIERRAAIDNAEAWLSSSFIAVDDMVI
jgi:hypothetical protein